METVIEVKDLRREYVTKRGVWKREKHIVKAVDGISFEVGRGEIFGLLGQNGAGKTTTIKMLLQNSSPRLPACAMFLATILLARKNILGVALILSSVGRWAFTDGYRPGTISGIFPTSI